MDDAIKSHVCMACLTKKVCGMLAHKFPKVALNAREILAFVRVIPLSES
jgi:hypothetical protein